LLATDTVWLMNQPFLDIMESSSSSIFLPGGL